MEETEVTQLTGFCNELYRLICKGEELGFRIDISEPGNGLYYLDVMDIGTGEREPISSYASKRGE